MMTYDQLMKDIKDYCIKHILSSNLLDWSNKNNSSITFILHNMRITADNVKGKNGKMIKSRSFYINVYSDSTLTDKVMEFRLPVEFSFKNMRENRALLKKHKEIEFFVKNRYRYDCAQKAHNLLPIAELRRKKLNSIKDTQE